MQTAIETEYQRHRIIGVADAIRGLQACGDERRAIQLLILRFPEAARYVPIGSRIGEPRLTPRAAISYREGTVHYWRPGNDGYADSTWLVPQ
jgi:hypothetical protein